MPFKWCLKAYKIAEAGIVLMSASVYVCRIFETFGFAKWRHLVLAIIYALFLLFASVVEGRNPQVLILDCLPYNYSNFVCHYIE